MFLDKDCEGGGDSEPLVNRKNSYLQLWYLEANIILSKEHPNEFSATAVPRVLLAILQIPLYVMYEKFSDSRSQIHKKSQATVENTDTRQHETQPSTMPIVMLGGCLRWLLLDMLIEFTTQTQTFNPR